MIGRRGFITGPVAVAVAPAIVRASSLMPVKVMIEPYGIGPAMHAIAELTDLHIFHREWLKDWEVAARYVTGDTVPGAGITYRAIR